MDEFVPNGDVTSFVPPAPEPVVFPEEHPVTPPHVMPPPAPTEVPLELPPFEGEAQPLLELVPAPGPVEDAPADGRCVVCDRPLHFSQEGEKCVSRPENCSRCCPHPTCHASSAFPA